MSKRETLPSVRGITEDRKSCISKAVKVTDQLAEVERICDTSEKKYETEVFRLTDISAKHILMEKKTADTLIHASSDFVSLAAFLKKALDEIRGTSGRHDKQISIEKPRSNGLKAEVTNLTGQVMEVEELLLISRPKNRMALVEVKKMDEQQ